jgi:radical S-adenosyl methionine domain-containing protein 2
MDWKNVRLSIAGGEPTLLKERLDFVISKAKQLGFKVSLITNGSLLDAQRITAIAPHLSCLGISLDSSNMSTNRLIGRVSKNGDVNPIDNIVKAIKLAREVNPAISIKINTVVNALNMHEDMSDLISLINPDRWKVMRVLPIITDALSITAYNYRGFVTRHAALSSVMSIEDNQDMVDSYIMIDPLGRFFQNSLGGSAYLYSSPIQEVGIAAAFAQTGFSPQKFAKRYHNDLHGEFLP